jgi:hypothetical protein
MTIGTPKTNQISNQRKVKNEQKYEEDDQKRPESRNMYICIRRRHMKQICEHGKLRYSAGNRQAGWEDSNHGYQG